ncbi:MAG TPA: PAS domain S-box protein [Acidobacteriota bacterium]|jgi:PAS domain S-box-containing protein|nr:PAS domain S-box protein [Acidobacteriota bacterium]
MREEDKSKARLLKELEKLRRQLAKLKKLESNRQRAEEALRHSEFRFRDLFDDAPVGYHEIDAEGRIIRVNRTELAMLGYSAEEMLDHYAWEFIQQRDTSREAVAAKIAGRQRLAPFERTFIRKDGTPVQILVQDRLLRDADGHVVGIRSTVQDITERKQAEEVLQRAYEGLEQRIRERTADLAEANEQLKLEIRERERADEERRQMEAQMYQAQKLESLGVLAGGIAHDFNNLLQIIIANVDLALRHIPPQSRDRKNIERIERAATRAAELTNHLLAYTGKGKLEMQPLDLSQVVEEIADLLESIISKKAILKYDFRPDLPAIQADATQLRQVIMNLITNASEALGDKTGVISVRTGVEEADRAYLSENHQVGDLAKDKYVYLEIADSGSGMDAETKGKIFDPFFTTKFPGRGLGLAAVLGIVRGHRGTIRVDAEPGRGTTFRVLFPCTEEPEQERAVTAQQRKSWQGSGTVLVVDDEEGVRDAARSILEESGFVVLAAHDGREGVEVFRKHSKEIVAVLLDMTMPHMNGEETFREIRRIQADAQVILSSGYDAENTANRFAGEGLAGFIHKPYQAEALIEKLREVLE